MPIHFDILRDGSKFFARPDGEAKFEVAHQVSYQGNRGLANDNAPLGRQYNYAAANFPAYGTWAWFIEPTAQCEGHSFLTLNTYDRAAFTFGFAQFAAHVPNGDFVTWLRTMLALPEAADYFPDLGVVSGRIVKHGATGDIVLETNDSTASLMKYLNPSLASVEDDEVIAAARLMHWTMKYPAAQDLQVKQMVATGHAMLKRADQRLGLDGVSGDLCCVVMDILHQGRGTFADMASALRQSNPYNALLQIGASPYPERVKTLRKQIDARKTDFTGKRWSRAKQELV